MAKATKPAEAAPKATKPAEGSVVHYQEWEVKLTNGKEEKLKIRRHVVKISEEEANILNTGILKGSNTYGLMYFLPEAE